MILLADQPIRPTLRYASVPLQNYTIRSCEFTIHFVCNTVSPLILKQYNTSLSHNIQQNLCVDNVISGSTMEADAVQYYHEARTILSDAEFKSMGI